MSSLAVCLRFSRSHRMLSRVDVETLALQTYEHWRRKDDSDSYWVTGRRAADVLA